MKARAVTIMLFLLATVCTNSQAREAVLSHSEIQDGWVLLFDGESMFGLSQEGALMWKVNDGSLIADGTAAGYIRTNTPFSDFVLKMEYLFAKPSGKALVFIRTAKGAIPVDNGYRIPLTDDDAGWPAGSIVQRGAAKTTRPQAGSWHSLQIEAQGSHITVWIDDRKVSEASDPSSRAGYIGLKVEAGSRLEYRNLKLKPLTETNVFNGTDLSGWKIATNNPPEKSGKLKKIIPFMGGKPNVKQSDWSVRAGAIHGENGPGQLETTAMYDDFILQFQMAAQNKKAGRAGIYVRGDAGNLFTGYEISMAPEKPGAIGPGLASPRKAISVSAGAVGTIAVNGRHFAVWINGFPVTEFTDTRAEGPATAKNAKVGAGTLSLPLHDSAQTAEFSHLQLAMLAKTLGGVIGKAPPPAPTSVAAPALPSNAGGAAAQLQALQQTQQQQQADRKQAAALMTQALNATDAATKMRLYEQVIQIDPTNQAAFQGFNDAKAKVEAQQQQAEKQRAQASEAEQNDAKRDESWNRAQQAFLRGDLQTASSSLAVAEQIAPGSAQLRELRQKITDAQAQRSRLQYLLLGGGVLGVGGLSTLLVFRRRKREGYLEVVSGLEPGHRYSLDQVTVRIGAISQDGGGKNDIVIRDVEHMISRFHCEIHHQNGKFYVVDCNSANGTRVDKKRVRSGEPKRLKNGARLELAGTTTLRFGLERRKVKA